jgi:tetratricopeptide (TPR) repeat protein
MHPELDKLIEAALADDKLTAKEMEVLIRKAKSLGIDEDEFLIELDAKKHYTNNKRRIEKKGRRVKIITILISALISVSFLIYVIIKPTKEEKFDEAISQYDFITAYKLLSKFSDSQTMFVLSERSKRKQQIIQSAVAFYIKNGNQQLALDAIEEYQFQQSPDYTSFLNRGSKKDTYNKEVSFYNTLILDIAFSYKDIGEVDKAIDIASKLKLFTNNDWESTLEPFQKRIDQLHGE